MLLLFHTSIIVHQLLDLPNQPVEVAAGSKLPKFTIPTTLYVCSWKLATTSCRYFWVATATNYNHISFI